MNTLYLAHVPDPSGSQLSQLESQPTSIDPSALSGNGKGNGFTYFDCPVCGNSVRVLVPYLLCIHAHTFATQMASNRFAPHLSNCMGLGTSRRGAARNSTAKAKYVKHSMSSLMSRSNGGFFGFFFVGWRLADQLRPI
jgi:hypothetical protein